MPKPADVNPTFQIVALAKLYDIPVNQLVSIYIEQSAITFNLKTESHAYRWSFQEDV